MITGNTPSTSDDENYEDNGLLWVTPTDIKEQITTKTAKQLSERGKQLARVLPPNSILVTCIASIGKNTLITTEGSCNQQINALIPYKEYEPYFLLTLSEFWSKKMKVIAGAGAMNIVNKTMFSEIETTIPKLEEQQKIGAFFTALDRYITIHQRK
ncbi:restriction endonuclease subunit S [Histophilus somni]|uniref:restriction endonuclease subunit S n=1 Tax=Histophilus somni TaxID=731 RepID=UPI003877E963